MRPFGAGVLVPTPSRGPTSQTPVNRMGAEADKCGHVMLDHIPPTLTLRSPQSYGVDPVTVRKSVELIAAENLADHIDMNFGWPKFTR